MENDRDIFGKSAHLNMPPLEYYALVRSFNNLIQQELRDKLCEHQAQLGNAVTLITPGSDGRREKGSIISPLEIIAILDEKTDPEIFEGVLNSVLKSITHTRISNNTLEIKNPDSSLVFFRNDSRKVQPARVADGRLIYGSEENAIAAKRRLGSQIIKLPSKSILGKVKNLETDARRATERGKNSIAGTDAIHFDLEGGVVYFNPEAYQLSFKIGPLRLVQNTLLVEEVKHTRREVDANFMSHLAAGIVNRLDQLSDDRMVNLNKESVKEIMEHYAFFLRLYHLSEQAYTQNGIVAIQLEKTEIDGIAKRLLALRELTEKFKIEKQPQKIAAE